MWEFGIDVGGTFTDCVARAPDGSVRRAKELSAGVVKGAIGPGSSSACLLDVHRHGAPHDFWRGYQVRILDAAGQPLAESQVAASDGQAGTLRLDTPLAATPAPGQTYELFSGEEAPILAIRRVLRLKLCDAIPPVRLLLGTTRGTNALLTRNGARTAFVTTRGLGDVLRIGYQNRPQLFELAIHKPDPLYAAVAEIDERVAATGEVLAPLDEAQARAALMELRQQGIESLAVVLLHADRWPAHERRVGEIARELGFAEISLSSEVAPLVKIVARGDTTVVDAYLTPVLRQYVARLQASLPGSDVRLMTSAGGLVRGTHFLGKDSILSGPAGGVIGFSRAAEAAGLPRAIGFDMGGTSTDVARFDGACELRYEQEKAGVRLVAPMLAIETVAAGGGSICRFDGVKLVVGPQSAGAAPGPACYGRGGPLTVADLNCYLGRLRQEQFPFALDRAAVERRLAELAADVLSATGRAYEPAELAAGLLQIANGNMVRAIQSVSLAQGYDVREYALVAFGGAAGQHACSVARELSVRQILDPADASLLSAVGMTQADIVRYRVQGLYRPYDPGAADAIDAAFAVLEAAASDDVVAEGGDPRSIVVRRSLDLRYHGVDAYLSIDAPADGDYAREFAEQHVRRYGYQQTGRPLEVVAARVEAAARAPRPAPRAASPPHYAPDSRRAVEAWFDGRLRSTAIYFKGDLQPGAQFTGPAIVVGPFSTTVVEPDWTAQMLSGGDLLLTARSAPSAAAIAADAPADPVLLEVFNNQFAAIAEQMGVTLRNTACSVNVKERLDFSCAIFTAAGDLVVNAPHIPVHLGAMGETVRRVLAQTPDLAPGDVLVTNDPYRGGSHLPDVTVVTPVHDPQTRELRFVVASRAHHAEIGGIRPGSMPPFSRTLAEEGVLIECFKLVAQVNGVPTPRWDDLTAVLRSGPYPSRNVAENLADLAAQAAANQQGVHDLQRLIERVTWPVASAYMRHIQATAERKMRAAIRRLPFERREFVDYLDDGAPLRVALTRRDDTLEIDFTGTSGVHGGNLNANRAIVTAAVLYVLRLLIDEEIPLNQGVLAPIQLVLPPGLLNPAPGATPAESPAVVGGNVETSQRIVDVLLGALGLAVASQGTMNNLLFGDSSFGYYETICGGSGATPAAAGADAVHTHMTNTRLTDPEVLELRCPVRLREFSIRRGSGGAGRHRGGDGVVRRIEFLRPLDVSLLTQRRGPYPPYGFAGGASGTLGVNELRRADGTVERLPGLAQFQAQAGDVLTVCTPGGGGWGSV